MPALPLNQIVARGGVPDAPTQGQQGSGVAGLVGGAAQLGAGIAGYVDRQRDLARQEREAEMRRLDANEADVQIINAQSRLDLKAQQRVRELQQRPEGLTGATDQLMKEFDGWVKEEEPSVNSLGQPKFASAAARMRGEINQRLAAAEVSYRNGRVAANFDVGLEDDRRLVYANPASFTDALARRRALAQSLTLPDDVREKLETNAREKLALGAATGIAERDPQQLLDRASFDKPEMAAEAVKNDQLLSNLTPEALQHVTHMARTELSRRAAEGRYDVAMRTKDVQSMVMAGVNVPQGVSPTVEEYTRLHGKDGPAMWQQEVGNFLEIGGAIQQMRTASFAERAQLVEGQKPAAGAGFAGNTQKFEAVQQAQKLVEKQIAADPAAYAAATSPRVQEAQRQLNEVLGEVSAPGTTFGSPTSRQAAIAAAVQRYASTTAAEQERLGVSLIRDDITGNKPRGPKLLTNMQANAISDQFSQSGANAAELVQGLEQSWGKHWPQVYAQLAGDNKLPPAALIIPNMPNDASRLRMAEVAKMKPDELKALVKPGDLKDLRDAVLTQFDEAQRTFTAQGASGNTTLATVVEGAEKLATLYMSQGQSAKAAAKQAYTETMGHKYQWGDTYRVPKTVDMPTIRRGTEAAVEDLVKSGQAKVFAGDAPQQLADDVLRARSMWITNQDETGLELRLRGADGGVYAVLGHDGRPVSRSWADLTTKAGAAKASDNTREGHEEWMRRRQQELNPRR